MPEPLLSVRHLSKTFAGVQAVQDVSFDVAPGQVVGLIGPNGAGKSTLINVISGFHPATAGEVWFRGQRLFRAGDRFGAAAAEPSAIARRGIVRTFQHIRLFPSLTVRQNVEAAAQARGRAGLLDALLRTPRYRQAMASMTREADDLLRLFEVDDLADRAAGTLAYGFQRRVEIVRALAARPSLLLLDEPAAGMNDVEAAALADFLGQVVARQHLAVILVEHHLDVVMRLCQHVLVLDHGALIAAGSPAEVTRHPEVVRAYLGEAAA